MPTITAATKELRFKQIWKRRTKLLKKVEELGHEMVTLGDKEALRSIPAKFAFYERVNILQDSPEVFGKTGSILGKVQADDGTWFYSVFVVGQNETWDIAESNLETLGVIDKREDFYNGKTVKIQVDKSGRGSISKLRKTKQAK